MQRYRHREFIRFLNLSEAGVPAGRIVRVILDNDAAHNHPKVLAWLSRHPRFVSHFTPTSCSWLNAVETVGAEQTAAPARGVRLDRGASGGNQALCGRAQCRAQALRADRRSRPRSRGHQAGQASLGVNPLEHFPIRLDRKMLYKSLICRIFEPEKRCPLFLKML